MVSISLRAQSICFSTRLLVLCAGTAALALPCLGQTTATWLSAVDGHWDDPQFWSIDPNYPNADQPNSGDRYDVLLDANGSPYTVLLDFQTPAIQVDRLTLDSADATVHVNGFDSESLWSFSATEGVYLESGTLLLSNGRIRDTAIRGTSGIFEIKRVGPGGQLAYFDNVTLAIDTFISESAQLRVKDSLWLDQATIELLGNSSGTASISGGTGTTTILSDLNLLGSGQIVMNQRSRLASSLTYQTVIGADIHILADDRANYADAHIWGGSSLSNYGTITANGQQVDLEIEADRIVNHGLIEATNDGFVDLIVRDGGTITTAEIGTLRTSSNGIIWVRGDIDNRGDTLRFDGIDGGSIVIQQIDRDTPSRILGGRIEAPVEQPLQLSGAILDGVTLAGTVEGTGTISNGLVMDGGRIAMTVGDHFVFTGGQTLSGTGTIEIQDVSYNSPNSLTIGSETSRVTFDPGITLHSKDDLRNAISAEGLINEGTILFDGTPRGGGLGKGLTGTFINRGLIHVRGGDIALLGDGLDSPAVNEGQILVDRGVNLHLGEGFDNQGQIVLRSGSKLTYYGQYSPTAFGAIVNEGAQAIVLRSTLDLNGQTLDLYDAFGPDLDSVEFQNDFRNGKIANSGPDLFAVNRIHTFENVQLDTDASFYGGDPVTVNGSLDILAGRTLYMGKVPGSTQSGVAGGIRAVTTPVTLGGTGEIVFMGGGNDPRQTEITSGNQPLTVQSGLTLRTDGGSFTFTGINQGLIQVNGASETLRLMSIIPDRFRNEGVIEVNAGLLLIDDDVTLEDLGAINIAPEADVFVVGNFDLLGQTLDIGGQYGGHWHIASGSGGFSDDPGRIYNGRIQTNGTVLSAGKTGLAYFDYAGTLENITLAGDVLVDNRNSLILNESLTLDNGRVQIGSNHQDITPEGTIRVFGDTFDLKGTGEIVFSGDTHENEFILFSNGSSGIDLVTIDPGITVRTESGSGGQWRNGTYRLENAGTFSADGGTLDVFAPADVFRFYNLGGVLEARNGGALVINQVYGDVGTLSIVNGGRIMIGGDTDRYPGLAGDYRISDAFTIEDRAVLELNGDPELGSTLTVAAGGSLIFNNTWTNYGTLNLDSGGVLEIEQAPLWVGSQNLNGTVVLTGVEEWTDLNRMPLGNATLRLDRNARLIANPDQVVRIGADVSAFNIDGGTFEGGIIDSLDGSAVLVSNGNNKLVNVQDIRADIDLTTAGLSISDSQWTGQISLDASSLGLDGAWENRGGVIAQDSLIGVYSAPAFWGSFDLTDSRMFVGRAFDSAVLIGAVTGTGAKIVLADYRTLEDPDARAVINNTGQTIMLDDARTNWELQQGVIEFGTIEGVGLSELAVTYGGGLRGVQVDAPIAMNGTNILTLTDATVAAGGIVVRNDNPYFSATVLIGENQTLAGFGDIVFAQGSSPGNVVRGLTSGGLDEFGFPLPAPTLEVHSAMTVRAEAGGAGIFGTLSAPLLNRGTLEAVGVESQLTVQGAIVTSDGGTLRAVDGGALNVQWLSGAVGNVELNTGGTLELNGVYTFDQAAAFDHATLSLRGSWSVAAPLLAQSMTLELFSLPTSGGELVQISDSLIQLRGTGSINALPSLISNNNQLQLQQASGLDLNGVTVHLADLPILLDGGGLTNGQIEGGSTNPLDLQTTGSLEAIVLNADVVFAQGAALNIRNAFEHTASFYMDESILRFENVDFTNHDGRRIAGSGRIELIQSTMTNAGTLELHGDLQIIGDLVQVQTGEINLNIFTPVDGPTDAEQFTIDGLATLSGTLRVEFADGYTFGFLDRYHILDFTSKDGWFDQVILPDLPEGLSWDLSALEEDGFLNVITIPGDANGDAVVDEADLQQVLSSFGRGTDRYNWLAGDLSGDGLVGLEDLLAVLANWSDANTPPSIDVPEPAGLGLMLLALFHLRNRPGRRVTT